MPDFDEIQRSDAFIDALAAGQSVEAQDQADAALAALLGSWRDETRWPPETGLVSESQAIAALDAGLAEKQSGPKIQKWGSPAKPVGSSSSANRSRRGLSVVGAAAAAVLCIGGFGAVVAGAGPGDALYGMRTMLFGAPKQVRDDQVALAARTELQQVQEMISRGDWEQAQDKLVAVSSQVSSIGDEQQKAELLDQFNDLSAKVVERDPEATAPPGIIYTVPPSANELVPAVAPQSSSSSEVAPSESGTSTSETAEQSSTGSSTSSAASTSAAPSTSASSAATSASTATTTKQSQASTTQTSAAATSTSATAKSTSTSPATTTSAAPRSPTSSSVSAATTTTAAPAQATSSTAAATTTSAPAAKSTASTSAAPAQSTATQTTSVQSAPAQTTAAPTSAAPTSAPTSAAPSTAAQTATTEAPKSQVVTPTTTTVVIPVPAG